MVGTIISHGFATLHELSTVYGTQDMHNMMEIISVDAHNKRIMEKAR